jgi:hypothetical protein
MQYVFNVTFSGLYTEDLLINYKVIPQYVGLSITRDYRNCDYGDCCH